MQLYNAADVLILSDPLDDRCSVIVMEGMAMGIPIVSPPNPLLVELLDPPTCGTTVGEVHTVESFASALIGVLMDEGLRNRQSLAARKKAVELLDSRGNLAQFKDYFHRAKRIPRSVLVGRTIPLDSPPNGRNGTLHCSF